MNLNVKYLLMKYLITLTLLYSLGLSAQDKWVDLIAGKPNMEYIDAKKELAKSWKIAYEPIMLGCVLDSVQLNRIAVQDSLNAKYFEQLTQKIGHDWKEDFQVMLNLKIHQKRIAEIEGAWTEYIMGRPYIQYLEAKQKTAKEWGLKYEYVLLGCTPDTPLNEEQTQKKMKSDAYLKRLDGLLGEHWKNKFQEDVDFNLSLGALEPKPLPMHPEQLKNGWVDCYYASDNKSIIEKRLAVAKAWNIHYMPYFLGCKTNTLLQKKTLRFELSNAIYFSELEKQLGPQWKTRFDHAITKVKI